MKICKQCKVNPVEETRQFYCSKECAYKFTRNVMDINQRKSIAKYNKLSRDSFKGVKIPETTSNKKELLSFRELGLGSQPMNGLSVCLRNINIIGTKGVDDIPIQTSNGFYATRRMKIGRFNMLQMEEAIKHYEKKYRETTNTRHKTAMYKWLNIWIVMDEYLKDKK